jgi:ribosomal-protein-alanine N-acetyltransferase
MIRRDMPAVLAIEKSCFDYPWDENDFVRCLRQRNCIGMVAEASEIIVGFFVYELQEHKLHLLNMAVQEDCRYRSIGSQMVKKLISKLSNDRRSRIICEVRETNLDAQLFFQRLGFRATAILPQFYLTCDCREGEMPPEEDAYQFEYRYGRPA